MDAIAAAMAKPLQSAPFAAKMAVVAALFIPATRPVPVGEHHMAHAELAMVPGGTITEG